MTSITSGKAGGSPWESLYQETVQAERVLTRQVYDRAFQLFLKQYAAGEGSPGEWTREYGRDEFLLAVDPHGKAVLPSAELLEDFRQAVRQYPGFARWFQEGALREWDAATPVLLAARWLCHLAGLRHGTVEIFLDPPGLETFTLIQIRGMDKVEAPGAFDLPCAGHVTGTDGPEEALRKELGEELNLSLEDLEEIRLVTQFAGEGQDAGLLRNSEFRTLYRAKVKAEALPRIRFTDGEVAGLAIISVVEMRELVKRYPERVASGMIDSIAFYR
jgi:isopentenyldiphosphate isomerase